MDSEIRAVCPMRAISHGTGTQSVSVRQRKGCTITPGQSNNSQDCLIFCPFESNKFCWKSNICKLYKSYIQSGVNSGIRAVCPMRAISHGTGTQLVSVRQRKGYTITPGQSNNSQDCLIFCPFESDGNVDFELCKLYIERL